VTPLTRKVTDKALISSLDGYAQRNMRYPIRLHLRTVYQTSTDRGGVLYDVQFFNDINEEYYALIESV